mgnify:CR=1 FL=1
MQTITVKDKLFGLTIPEIEILKQVKRIAEQITKDYEGQLPIFLVVLNGAYVFAADLLRSVELPCEISFVKFTSYEGDNDVFVNILYRGNVTCHTGDK